MEDEEQKEGKTLEETNDGNEEKTEEEGSNKEENEEKQEEKKPKKIPQLFECRKKKTHVCRKAPCEEEFDPKSYCHNILAQTGKVCRKAVCRRFLRTNRQRTKGEVICIPRKPCKLKRHFGPEEEGEEDEEDDEVFFRMYGSQLGLILDEGTVSDTDVLQGRFGGSKYVNRDGRFGGRDGGYMTKYGLVQNEETAKFLEELAQYLDPEGMAALAALAGADLCPCCKCPVCRCKLRGVTSEMLLNARKRALLEKRLRGALGYSFSFDYFYHPDFDEFARQREARLERERKAAEEEQQSILMEEILKETYYESEVGEDREMSIQVSPSMEDRGADPMQDLDEEARKRLRAKGMSTEPSLASQSLRSAPPPTYKTSSLARSSIESWVQQRQPMAEGKKPTTILDAAEEPLDVSFPEVEIRSSVHMETDEKVPEIIPGVPASVLDAISDASSIRWVTKGWIDMIKKRKAEKKPITKADIKSVTSKAASMAASKEIEEAEDEASSDDYDSIKERAKARAEERIESIPPSKRKYADVCECLPGFCICGEHFAFKGPRKDLVDFSGFIKPLQSDKTDQIDDKRLSEKTSCICYHPWEEDMDRLEVTPVESEKFDFIAPEIIPKMIVCKRPPQFQKTLIIVRPEAMKFKDVILRCIQDAGLHVVNERTIRLSPEQAAEIYSENYGSAYFPMFVQRLSSSPILVLCIAGLHAFSTWNKLIGEDGAIPSSWFYPESVRRRFGIYADIPEAMKTSADLDAAKTEIRYFFPLDILEPIMIESGEVQDYCDKYIHPTLLRCLFKIVKEKPKDPLLFLAEWILKNNPFQPIYPDPLISLAPF